MSDARNADTPALSRADTLLNEALDAEHRGDAGLARARWDDLARLPRAQTAGARETAALLCSLGAGARAASPDVSVAVLERLRREGAFAEPAAHPPAAGPGLTARHRRFSRLVRRVPSAWAAVILGGVVTVGLYMFDGGEPARIARTEQRAAVSAPEPRAVPGPKPSPVPAGNTLSLGDTSRYDKSIWGGSQFRLSAGAGEPTGAFGTDLTALFATRLGAPADARPGPGVWAFPAIDPRTSDALAGVLRAPLDEAAPPFRWKLDAALDARPAAREETQPSRK
ncbi:MAG TPA: hypothetical protein VD971_04800 [Phycisphaerales bacterium]|nr:hypothetical protein [Phycisphaerales bacterium]